MTRHSTQSISIRPDVAERLNTLASQPASFYRMNQSFESSGIRFLPKFDEGAIIDRELKIKEGVITAHLGLKQVIDHHVDELDIPARVSTLVSFNRRKPDQSGPVRSFFSIPDVREGIGGYHQVALPAYDELFFWARQRRAMGSLATFLLESRDPQLAQKFIKTYSGLPLGATWHVSENPQAATRADNMKRQQVQDTAVLVSQYGVENNEKVLKKRLLKDGTGLLGSIAIGLRAVTRIGAQGQQNVLLHEIKTVSALPSVELQLLGKSLHGVPVNED